MSLVLLLVSVASGLIQGIPGISATIKQTIAALSGSLNAVVASGITTTLSPTVILAALTGIITALKADPAVSPATLQLITGLEDAVTAALTADQAAQKQVAPTTLQPITPIS